ncbi:hypothetical protein GCM10023063_40750 [Arthrobacter methylotrophus]
MKSRDKRFLLASGASALAASTIAAGMIGLGMAPVTASANDDYQGTATPIKHVVVIFGENVSFDHYFATYPQASNTPGETQQGTGAAAPAFTAAKNTPKNIATLAQDKLLAPNNPNSVQPRRLTPGQAITCDQDHEYTAEQKAYNSGRMNKFVENTSMDNCSGGQFARPGLTMDYYDGNTVTGIWNYAQNFAMSDSHFSTTFGPSSPGAQNLVSGQTHGVSEFTPDGQPVKPASSDYTVKFPDANGVGTMTEDPDPVYDDCSNKSHASKNNLAGMQGKNIGDLLNDKGIS